MYEIIESLKGLIGLNSTPVTVVELICWVVLVLCACAVLSGVIKLMWHMATNARRIVG